MGRAEISSGIKTSCGGSEQTPCSSPTAAAGLLSGWGESGTLTLTPAGKALKPRLGFASHRFAVLVLLHSFPLSFPIYVFLTLVLVLCLRQSLECDSKRFWTPASMGVLKGCRVCSHSSNNAESLEIQCGFCRTTVCHDTQRGSLGGYF